MIEVNQLRIGNWVKSQLGELMQVKQLGIVGNPDYIFAQGPEGFGMNGFDPIPLTAEILEAVGAKYGKTDGISSFEEGESNAEGVTHYWDIGIKRTALIESHTICLVKWGEQEYFTFQLERGFYRQKIKFLHQLQNLYFFLSGTELTYNPQNLKSQQP